MQESNQSLRTRIAKAAGRGNKMVTVTFPYSTEATAMFLTFFGNGWINLKKMYLDALMRAEGMPDIGAVCMIIFTLTIKGGTEQLIARAITEMANGLHEHADRVIINRMPRRHDRDDREAKERRRRREISSQRGRTWHWLQS